MCATRPLVTLDLQGGKTPGTRTAGRGHVRGVAQRTPEGPGNMVKTNERPAKGFRRPPSAV